MNDIVETMVECRDLIGRFVLSHTRLGMNVSIIRLDSEINTKVADNDACQAP